MAFASPIPRAQQFDLGQFFTQVSQEFAQSAPQWNAFDSFVQVPTQSPQSGSGGGYGPRPGGTRKPGYGR